MLDSSLAAFQTKPKPCKTDGVWTDCTILTVFHFQPTFTLSANEEYLEYPELGQFRNIFYRFYLLHYSENNKDQTNAHRSSSMDKAGADHYAGNSYNQPDRAKEKDSWAL